MKKPTIFAFTDCKDPNALTRLTARLSTLFADSSIYSVGIDSDIGASGCILDTLDALRIGKSPHIIIGNLAPRQDKSHKNGAPFYIGRIDQTIIVATKTCFTLLSKFNLIKNIEETDVATVCRKFLPREEANRIANSQFRSFEYVPRLARWAYEGKKFPTIASAVVPLGDNQIWWIDNFGNAKTTITEKEIKAAVKNGSVSLRIAGKTHSFPFYQKLSDVPKGKKAVIIGSSGYKDTRFAEIVIQGKSASSALALVHGTLISF
ncbi:MAG: SAM hydroxide adenosyltransferase [Patescibacteria group bacterium]